MMPKTTAKWQAQALEEADQWEAEGNNPVLFWSGWMFRCADALLKSSIEHAGDLALRLRFCLDHYDLACIRGVEKRIAQQASLPACDAVLSE